MHVLAVFVGLVQFRSSVCPSAALYVACSIPYRASHIVDVFLSLQELLVGQVFSCLLDDFRSHSSFAHCYFGRFIHDSGYIYFHMVHVFFARCGPLGNCIASSLTPIYTLEVLLFMRAFFKVGCSRHFSFTLATQHFALFLYRFTLENNDSSSSE